MKQLLIFTDLDGTLLDHATYSCQPAYPALKLIREKRIPLIFCSSKTRKELEHYRRLLDNHDPFVTENGGGIFIPEGYFDLSIPPPGLDSIKKSGYTLVRLGAPYSLLRLAVQELRDEGFAITGFGDMTAAEVAGLTGLDSEQAAMAKEREFDEPFIYYCEVANIDKLCERIRAKGLHSVQGNLFHILGNSDKGKAVDILASLFRQRWGEITIVALGDSPNDLPMLRRADYPVAIRKPNGSHDPSFDLPHLIRAEGIGPAGWNEAVLRLLRELVDVRQQKN
jgi:mannosyl-3-phosphoglycerate phosphatase family protein